MTTHESLNTPNEVTEKSYELEPISSEPEAQEKRGWAIEVNETPIEEPITSARWVNDRLGIEVKYGQRQEGYDGPIIYEKGGGGSVIIPYMIHPNTYDIFIGVVREYRPTTGGYVWNVPRGLLTPGENHEDGAIRELAEETGYQISGSRVIKLIDGLNPNSTYFDTTEHDDDQDNAGVSIFAVAVDHKELLARSESEGTVYSFPQKVREATHSDRATEKITGSRFISISEAIKSKDMFTSAAAGQLLAAFFEGRMGYHPDVDRQLEHDNSR